jgi:16S rRNA (guanine1516-N2)-methyltransferase
MIAITAESPDQALQLQQTTGLPLLSEVAGAEYLLNQTEERIELRSNIDPSLKPVYVDFIKGKNRHRRIYGGGKGQDIAKAVGLKKLKNPTVADLTAGLGRDAFVLASLGCDVTLVERSPVVHALLQDALRRAHNCGDEEILTIVASMHLVRADALEWLAVKGGGFDVIYLDPMFPERTKSALVKKEMRFFHDIVGEDMDADLLLDPARAHCRHRVVVKRPAGAPSLDGQSPAYFVGGKSTRFDVYLGND